MNCNLIHRTNFQKFQNFHFLAQKFWNSLEFSLSTVLYGWTATLFIFGELNLKEILECISSEKLLFLRHYYDSLLKKCSTENIRRCSIIGSSRNKLTFVKRSFENPGLEFTFLEIWDLELSFGTLCKGDPRLEPNLSKGSRRILFWLKGHFLFV